MQYALACIVDVLSFEKTSQREIRSMTAVMCGSSSIESYFITAELQKKKY